MLSNQYNFAPLYDVCKKIADLYRQKLDDVGAVAEGHLKNFSWDIEYQNSQFSLYFNLEEYWKWVEEGRPPTKTSGWNEPIEDLKRWIQVKHLVPRPNSKGKVPTIDQQAYAIYMKITREGYQGRQPLEKAMQSADEEGLIDLLTTQLYDALSSDLDNEIQQL